MHALDVLLPDKALHAGNAPGNVAWHAALHLQNIAAFQNVQAVEAEAAQ